MVVAGGDTAPGSELATGLRDLEATVHVTTARFESAESAIDAFDAFESIDALVHVPFDEIALVRAAFAAVDEGTWDARGEGLIRSALWSVQAAYRRMVDRGGRIVLVVPVVGLVGGVERVPLATAGEGMRALAKVAARQWGNVGITVNCVAVALDPSDGGPLPPALARRAELAHEVAAVVAFLLSDAAAAVTGVTIPVDGGVVMLP